MTPHEPAQASLRSALLGLSTRIAEAQSEDAVCQAVVAGLHHPVFAFEGVGLFLSGAGTFAPELRATAGTFGRAAQDVSELRVPLRIDQSAIGELVVQRDRSRAFEKGDMEILGAATNQASMAIGRARLIAAERQRLVEQRALLETLTDLSGELELDRLLQSVLRRAMELLDVTGGELAIYDERTDDLVIVASYNMEVNAVGVRMKRGEGAMGHVAQSLEPLIIPRYQEWEGRSNKYTQSTVQSVMAAPLMIGTRLVGAIASVHEDPARTFGEVDLRLLNLFAAQAAIAIENARLFTTERERASEHQALLDSLADLSGELELDRVLGAVLERAIELLGVTGGELAIFEEATEQLVIVASHNMEVNAVGSRMALGEGAMGHVGQTHEPLIIPRYQEWTGRSAKYTQSTVQGVMAAPLLIGHRLVGAIASVHEDPTRELGQSDLRRLMMFAPQAAIAIENARLFTAERQRAQEQQALLDTLQDLSGELKLEKLLHRVLERAASLLGVTGGELATFDEARGDLEIVASHNLEVNAVGSRMSLGEGAMGHVAQTHEPIIIPRYPEWMGRSNQYQQSSIQSVMAGPLMIGTRLVGAIATVHEDPHREFGDGDLRRLMMFAPQAAVAIENARLFAAAQRYYENLVLSNPLAIVNLDTNFNITTCNPAFEQMFGYTSAEAVGRNLDDLVTTAETRGEAAAYTQRGLAGQMTTGTGRRRRKDGTMLDVELFTIPVMVGGEQVGLIAMYHDVSELYEARRTAETASEAKSQFLASMSHELRTPLNAILGYSEMLEEDAAAVGQGDLVPDLQKIHAAGRHLLALINDVLDLSKIEAGKMELFVEAFDVEPLVRDVSSTVQPLIAKHRNTLDIQMRADVGVMRADVTRVRQVLFNLLSNASKFTEGGTISLRAKRAAGDSGEAGAIMVFEVADTGIGMTEEQLGRLFQAFQQAEVSTSARYGGTGLGLAVSKMFCEMMGGTITVASTPGEGTTFTVRLPTEVAAAAATAPSTLSPASAGVEESGGETVATVLVIDDDAGVRNLMGRFLRKEGFRVLEAAGGEDGLRLARAERPDAITLDVLMPGMDGWAVLTALKADRVTSEIPVVMLTIVDEKNLGYTLGASEYLTKPIDRKRLVAVLKRHAAGRERSVLIVEDDEATRGVLTRTLAKEGWTTLEAANGRIALERLGEAVPGLILLDLMMPEMDGFQFLETLRARAEWQNIPVAVITAKDLTPDDHRRLNGGVERVVHKGGRGRDELLREVRALVASHAVRGDS